VLCPRAPAGASYTSDILGHLKHHIRLQRPEELRMMVREMLLDRGKELLVGAACELRPALAPSDPSLPSADRCHLA
jgi:hypothetical protein